MRQTVDSNEYLQRHIGPNKTEVQKMLDHIGLASLDELIDQTIPQSIRNHQKLELPEALSEQEYLQHIQKLAHKNQVYRTYIGMGYYNTITPAVIQRNLFENPAWYTQYTPYQAEISQGRLESLFNFQTMITELTAMDIANASLLDEPTAAAEAMSLLYRARSRKKQSQKASTFFVSENVFKQSRAVVSERAHHLGINIVVGNEMDLLNGQSEDQIFAVLLQYPNSNGGLPDYRELVQKLDEQDITVAVGADLLALTLLTPPGEWGADVVFGNSQRFGVPLGYGGPHAAYFATRDEHKRNMPGRLIGQSVDQYGQESYRLALQTREQHIRREKATSNICTAQALLANMAAMYAVYHGPAGLKKIASRVHSLTHALKEALVKVGYHIQNQSYFDTLLIKAEPATLDRLKEAALARQINLFYDAGLVGVALDETVNRKDLQDLIDVFAQVAGAESVDMSDDALDAIGIHLPEAQIRQGSYLSQSVFHDYQNETSMMRYLRQLSNKDLALDTAMIPLGSCTMKLNPAVAMMPLSWPEFAQIHPMVPDDQVQGYIQIIKELENTLAHITGFSATSLQPNSGAQGEYAGLLAIKAYHQSRGDKERTIALIPSSAHGTNPASASLAGLDVKIVKCDSNGNIDLEDLKNKASQNQDRLCCLMVTYPSTHGVFEEEIIDICKIVHDHGGQVYMDGANLNAQLGLTSPGFIGADVCHLNLHKTFAIPHGGGGPGMGPICVASHLAPFLPADPFKSPAPSNLVGPVSAAPYGSASILLISYAYIRMLGASGLEQVTKLAILNANYICHRLKDAYSILYSGKNDRVAHEMILDVRPFKKHGIEVDDVAKRLIDYGFHAPTMSFPVPGTLMIEPTESEPLYELDRFCDAMLEIRREIEDVIQQKVSADNNLLKNAPHTAAMLIEKELPYDKMQAAFPLKNQSAYKYWPPVARVDNVYGDRNLVCSCPPLSSYETSD